VKEEDPHRLKTLHEICSTLRIDRNYCDILMIGDGSGSMAEQPGGWAVNIIEMERESHLPVRGTLLAGGQTQASINFLEAATYWYGLHHLHYVLGWDKRVKPDNPAYVVIVTDSEWTAQAMGGACRLKAHKDLKTMFDLYRSWGYLLYWHHTVRDKILLNNLADVMSASAREYMAMLERVDPLKLIPADGNNTD
jgi:ribonuclease HI